MKKIFFAILLIFSALAFSKEIKILEKKLITDFNKNFPVLEDGKRIKIKEIDVDIKKNGAVEVEVDFAKGSQTSPDKYEEYAEILGAVFKERLYEVGGSDYYLSEIEIDTSGIGKDKKTFYF
ncbi:hypothetical protein [Fusobacterium sp. PH5-44]|uniref:hypothetical protein n=1 Tax=unclassified Fusobacterium TaxID=2648384 RepID=UPI003D1B8E23